jgi:hypothetical protein
MFAKLYLVRQSYNVTLSGFRITASVRSPSEGVIAYKFGLELSPEPKTRTIPVPAPERVSVSERVQQPSEEVVYSTPPRVENVEQYAPTGDRGMSWGDGVVIGLTGIAIVISAPEAAVAGVLYLIFE